RWDDADPSRPLLLIARSGTTEIVAACCPLCRVAGVRPGMALAQARPLVIDARLSIAPHDPQRDEAALVAAAAWMTRLAPSVAADPLDGLLADVTGCERMYRGEDRLAQRVIDALARQGLRARLTIASSFGCAWALARYGRAPCQVIADGQDRAALAPLP